MFWIIAVVAAKLTAPIAASFAAGGFLAEKLTGKDNKSPLIYTDDIIIGSDIFKGPFVFTPMESNNVMGFLVYDHQYESAVHDADISRAHKVRARIDLHQSKCYKIQNVLRAAKERASSKSYAHLL
jgi:hypothetical protein